VPSPLRSTDVGVGLKPQHLPALASDVSLAFVEVHAENCIDSGSAVLRSLERVRAQRALSVHGVGLSIGGATAPDAGHLRKLRALLQHLQPCWFSEHLAWSSHGGVFFNDLLPLAYDAATLARVCAHVEAVQLALGRQLLLENPSTYVEFEASTMDEAEFLGAVVRRTGCGLLLDVNNAYVSAVNHGRDDPSSLAAWLGRLPLDAVAEIHLAGFAEDRDAAGARLLVDDHGHAVDAAVWALYRQVIARLGPRPTLIERDQNLPSFGALRAEAMAAGAILRVEAARREVTHASA
jgi:uncharacterized protein